MIRIGPGIAVGVGLCLTSCSFSTAFAVSNRTTSDIEIAYSLGHESDMSLCIGPTASPPFEADAGEIRWWRAVPRWERVPQSDYSFDEDACVFAMVVAPGRSVAVLSVGNYTGSAAQERRFAVGWLEITKPGHRPVRYEREQLLTLFKRRGDLVYELSVVEDS